MAPLIEEVIKKNIVEQLMWDDSVNANDVHVEIIDDTARLTGSVPNYTAKLAAERNAFMVEGIKNVENLLEVIFPPTVTIPTDGEIKSNINNILSWYSDFSGDIDVEVKNNIVSLTGSVDNYREKVRAEEIANSVKGVIDVLNNINIRQQDFNDTKIENDVKEAFKRNVLVDEAAIDVEVVQGVVVLRGTVKNQLIKKEVSSIAYNTKGVKNVIDDELIVL